MAAHRRLLGVSASVSCGRYPYNSTNCFSDFSTSPLTARAAAEPTGPNNARPPSSRRRPRLEPCLVGWTVSVTAYFVPPLPDPDSATRCGGSHLVTVHVTRLRKPLARATPTIWVPLLNSAGSSLRHASCITSHSPSSERSDTCSHMSCGLIGTSAFTSTAALSDWVRRGSGCRSASRAAAGCVAHTGRRCSRLSARFRAPHCAYRRAFRGWPRRRRRGATPAQAEY